MQGEGANTGTPAVFLRFAGCNLWPGREEDRADAVCRFCGTDFVGTGGPGGGRFAVFCFEVITYLHHYGLVRGEDEEPGPQHSWAHHRWLTNCLTFNNTFQSDHPLRPGIPYCALHAMYGGPRLPASYFTMFCVALVPPLWRTLMDKRLDAVGEAHRRRGGELPEELGAR